MQTRDNLCKKIELTSLLGVKLKAQILHAACSQLRFLEVTQIIIWYWWLNFSLYHTEEWHGVLSVRWYLPKEQEGFCQCFTPNWSSPLPWTSKDSDNGPGRTLIAKFVSASAIKRFPIFAPVTYKVLKLKPSEQLLMSKIIQYILICLVKNLRIIH
jgi:hypothetical protein